MNFQLFRSVRAVLLGLVAAFAAAGAANATAYVGKWDPAYGDPFNNLGWRGEINIDAPGDCGASSGFTGIVTCAPGAAVVNYAFVELYLLSDPGTTIDTLTFAPPAPATFTVNKLQFTAGELTGAVTGMSSWLYNADLDVNFALEFAVNGVVGTPLPAGMTVPTDYSGPILIYQDKTCIEEHHKRGDYDHDDECDCYKFTYGTNDLVSTASRPVLAFAAVPEPGSLALVLAGGLMAGGLYRRRSV
jgi:hypothetical protein